MYFWQGKLELGDIPRLHLSRSSQQNGAAPKSFIREIAGWFRCSSKWNNAAISHWLEHIQEENSVISPVMTTSTLGFREPLALAAGVSWSTKTSQCVFHNRPAYRSHHFLTAAPAVYWCKSYFSGFISVWVLHVNAAILRRTPSPPYLARRSVTLMTHENDILKTSSLLELL